MRKKHKIYAITLLEIMIVIVLIGIIGSVIGVNMKGSLDEGRAFKTTRAAQEIEDILMLEVAKGTPIDQVLAKKENYLEYSGMVKNPKKLLKDGWGKDFRVYERGGKIVARSDSLKAYRDKKKLDTGISSDEDLEE